MEQLLKIDRGLLLAALFLAGFIVYIPALKAPFFWDDYVSVPELQPYQGALRTESRPLRLFSFTMDSLLWRGNPAGYHFTNILLSALAGVLAFLFLEEFFKNRAYSFMASLLFILHPAHTEAVIWIKNRTEMLFLIFFILAFLTRKKNLALSVAMFILCTLAKETSVIFPLILTLHIYLFEKTKKYSITAPFYLIALIRGGYALLHAEEVLGIGSAGGFFTQTSLVFNTYGFYLGKLLFPARLLVDWQPSTAFSPAALLVFLGLGGALFLPKLDKNMRFFLALLFVSILPYSNIVFIAGRPLGEQRLFLPSLAFASALTLLAVSVVKSRPLRYSLLSLVIILYAGKTALRAREWRDPVLLWEQAEKLYPGSPRIKYNLGGIFYQKGDYARARDYYMRALGHAENTEGYYLLAQNLALVSMRENDLSEAERLLKGLLAVRPDDHMALYNLGLVSMKMGKYEAAAVYLEKVKKQLPNAIQIYNNLAVSYMEVGRPEAAVAVLKDAIAIDPGYENGVYNLIVIYKKSGMKAEALEEAGKAVRLFPYNPAFLKLYQELKV
ncbi:MAG: tetratricopeptide repeat protein [Elusimicrobiales bacterium]|nr:tetratricopeptide repeat protein [Elusimicrobiales bacterium]